MEKRTLLKPKRIVVKVGTAILTAGDGRLNKAWIKKLTAQLANLIKQEGIEVVVVSSGAIGAGMGLLGWTRKPQLLPRQQAAAAVGQGQLMQIYSSFLRRYNLLTAQILLTREDFSSRKRYLNAKNTLFTLLSMKVVPIINENDTVSVDEIRFGDNDRLSALVANLVHADLLIMLSDVDGLYLQKPPKGKTSARKELVPVVHKIDAQIEKVAGRNSGPLGIGGMATKVEAAKVCMACGIACIVANGKVDNVLMKILQGEELGTLFIPQKSQLVAKKRWIGFSTRVCGQIVVDEGAKQALVLKNKSLLPKGITDIRGKFSAGDTVSIVDVQNREFARGLVNYSSADLAKIKGEKSERIAAVLGYKDDDEVVHRDRLVVL